MSTDFRPRTRVPKKRTDPIAIILLLVCVAVLPVLGLLGWKMLQQRQAVASTRHTQHPPMARTTDNGPEAPLPRMGSAAGDMSGDNIEIREQKLNVPRTRTDTLGVQPDDFPSRFEPPRNQRQREFNAPGQKMRIGGGGGGHTDVTQAMNGVEGVVRDALSLPKKVLVVWLIDSTGSAANLRSEVAGKLNSFYGSLGAKGEGDDAPVLSVVGQFAKEVKFITENPVADAAEVQKAVEQVAPDQGFVENTFAAIQAAADKVVDYRKKKGRFVTIVVVTDEAGNDRETIDAVLPKLQPYGIPVQVIGPSALFGQMEGMNRTSEGEPKPGEIRVVQGPETHDIDWINIGYNDAGNIDTGLGPYHLARLCKETDGKYFALSHGAGNLKALEPHYTTEADYKKLVESNKAVRALIDAGKLAHADVQSGFTTRFENDDEVKRNRALDAAQKPIAKVMPGIDRFIDTLKIGEPDLAKLTNPADKRWRASFELAYGRAAAAKVRHEGFILMTAQMKGGRKFQNANSTYWVLQPTNDPMGISVLDKMATKARDYLNHLITEYPDTPWADAAKRELQTPLAWKWVEE